MIRKFLDMNAIIEQHPEIENMADEEQLHFNHEGCEAGRDTKRRLFVRKRSGSLLGFCHHCGLGGIKGGERSYIKRGNNLMIEAPELQLPSDLQSNPVSCHVLHNSWLFKYRIDGRPFNIGWSEHNGRTILPVYNNSRKLVAYQRRRILPHDHGPKYLTTRLKYAKHPVFKAWPVGNIGTHLVLTEDILSAVKLYQAGHAAWSLLGTYLHEDVVDEIVSAKVKEVLVWFDDDNADVMKKQRKVHDMLAPYVDNVIVVKKKHLNSSPIADPKAFSENELTRIINERLRGAI